MFFAAHVYVRDQAFFYQVRAASGRLFAWPLWIGHKGDSIDI
jgi:hypothetical protein